MIDKLKEFVSKNKTQFDTEEPSKGLWEKIDSRIQAKNTSAISSKWLSRLKYFGLSSSILMIVTYLITQSLSDSSSKELVQSVNDSAMNTSGKWVKINHDKNKEEKSENNESNANKTSLAMKNSSLQTEHLNKSSQNTVIQEIKDSVSQTVLSEASKETSLNKENNESTESPVSDKKESKSTIKIKKGKVNVPAEPEKINTYSGTLYDGYSLCSVLRAYKFPGQVSMDETGNYTSRQIMKTVSCNRLENTTNAKAVWIKGKTSKKLTISIKEGFKNIVLVKNDGQEVKPIAISHYYPGLGVISDYAGKHFDMIFKERVELILFFKDIEEGDKISIDGKLEAAVKTAP